MGMIMRKSERQLFRLFAWILTGLVISFAACSMLLSGSLSMHKFYNVGNVYDISSNTFRIPIMQDGGHQEKTGKVVLDKGVFVWGIPVYGNRDLWNYLCVQLKDTDEIQWKISYDKQIDGEIAESEEYDYILHSGMNLLEVPHNSFTGIRIVATGNEGDSFCVANLQLRENSPVWDAQKAVFYFIGCFFVYLCVSVILLFIWHKAGIKFYFYSWVELLQKLYIMIVEQFRIISVYIKQNIQNVKFYRVLAFVVMFVYSIRVETQDTYYEQYQYHVVVYSVLIILIGILSIENVPKIKKWNNSLVWCWIILWLMADFSDFMIPKDFRFLGYIMIFIVGFFIFIWNNMKKPEELLQDFTCAVHIFFVLICIFCILCRPESEGIRYSGISRNPGVFGLYLGTIWAVVLGEIETRIYEECRCVKMLPYIIEACLVFSFAWKAQSAGPLLCMLGTGVIWALKIIYSVSKSEKHLFVKIILCVTILLVPVYKGLSWGLTYVPQYTGISVTYVKEEPVAKKEYGMVVYAKDLKEKFKDSRIGQKFSSTTISGMLSQRDYFYRTYLRDMNIFGHGEKPELWGVDRLPHNSVLGIAHRYGIFACVPYMLMLLSTVTRTFKYSIKMKRYASVPFFVCLSSIVMSMADNVELPFLWLPWFGMYLMMGIAFDDELICVPEKKIDETENGCLNII